MAKPAVGDRGPGPGRAHEAGEQAGLGEGAQEPGHGGAELVGVVVLPVCREVRVRRKVQVRLAALRSAMTTDAASPTAVAAARAARSRPGSPKPPAECWARECRP